MKTDLLRTLIVSLALAATAAFGQAPGIISHQGKVTVGGNSFTGTGLFKFALVHTNVNAITDWSNDGSSTAGSEPTAAVSLAVSRGIFSVNLGDTTLANMTTVPVSVFTNSTVYLRVWFNDGTNGSVQLSPPHEVEPSDFSGPGRVGARVLSFRHSSRKGDQGDGNLRDLVALGLVVLRFQAH